MTAPSLRNAGWRQSARLVLEKALVQVKSLREAFGPEIDVDRPWRPELRKAD